MNDGDYIGWILSWGVEMMSCSGMIMCICGEWVCVYVGGNLGIGVSGYVGVGGFSLRLVFKVFK